jgi:hypothetical protein
VKAFERNLMSIKYLKTLCQMFFPSPNLNGLKCIKNDIKVHLWSNEPMVLTWGSFFSNVVQKQNDATY